MNTRTYVLVKRMDRLVPVDEAPTPIELDYMKVHGQQKWGVCVRLNGRLHLIAEVDLCGTDAYNLDFKRAMQTFRHEIQHGDDYGEFDEPLKFPVEWPVVDFGQFDLTDEDECGCSCNGCNGCDLIDLYGDQL